MTWTRPKGDTLTYSDLVDCLREVKPSVGTIVVGYDYGLDSQAAEAGVAWAVCPCITVKTEHPVPDDVQDRLVFYRPVGVPMWFIDNHGGKRVVPVLLTHEQPSKPELDIFAINREFS